MADGSMARCIAMNVTAVQAREREREMRTNGSLFLNQRTNDISFESWREWRASIDRDGAEIDWVGGCKQETLRVALMPTHTSSRRLIDREIGFGSVSRSDWERNALGGRARATLPLFAEAAERRGLPLALPRVGSSFARFIRLLASLLSHTLLCSAALVRCTHVLVVVVTMGAVQSMWSRKRDLRLLMVGMFLHSM